MDDTTSSQLTQIKDEPSDSEKKVANHCDEFVDYTMVSVPLSASEIAEMNSAPFTDPIIESSLKEPAKSKQSELGAESMEVDEQNDPPDTSVKEDTAKSSDNAIACDTASTSTETKVPSSQDEQSNEPTGAVSSRSLQS